MYRHKIYFSLLWYDGKISASHNDTIMIMNRGITVGKENYGGMGLHGRIFSSLLGPVDIKYLVINIFSS